MTDFTFTTDGLFYTLWPENRAAEVELSKFMASNEGSAKIPVCHWWHMKAAMAQSGWSLSKKRASKRVDDDQLLAELAL